MKAVVMDATWSPRPGYPITEQEERTGLARQACGVFKNPTFTVKEITQPTPGRGEVLIKVGAVGVCGSDTHCYETDDDGYMLFSGPVSLPSVLGHEYTGTVVELGPGVLEMEVGDLVAAEGMLYCGVCEACKIGYPNQCSRLDMLGFSASGAYAEYITIHEKHLWKLNALAEKLGSKKRALEIGALVEPIACPFNGMWPMGEGMLPGSHVAVYGAGPIGLGAILLARAAGAATITAFDIVDERRDLAIKCGADYAHNPITLNKAGTRPSEIIREVTNGWGADLQIEAAGAARSTMPDIDLSWAPRGTMIYLGRSGGTAPVELDRMVSGASKIVGSRGHAGGSCFPNVIRMLVNGVLDPSAMISAHMGIFDAVEALERSTLRTDGKIMLTAE